MRFCQPLFLRSVPHSGLDPESQEIPASAGMRESEDNAIVICNALFLSELNYLLQGFAVMAARKATHRFGVKALFRRIAEG